MNKLPENVVGLDELWFRLQALEGFPEGSPYHDLYKLRETELDVAIANAKRVGNGSEAMLYKRLLEVIVEGLQIDLSLLEASVRRKFDEQGYGANIEAQHWAVPVLAASLGEYLFECGGENYVETGFTITRNARKCSFSVILRHLDGEMPSYKAARLEAENKALKERIAQLESQSE